MSQNLRGYYGAALRHIDSGIKILSELKLHKPDRASSEASEKESYAPTKVLSQVFTGLDMKATQMMLFRSHLSSEFRDSDPEFSIPTSFRTIEEATESLSELLASGLRVVCSLWLRVANDTGLSEREACRNQLEKIRTADRNWSAAFDRLRPNLGSKKIRACHMLKLYQIPLSVALDVEPEKAVALGEMRWDKYTREFARMIELADELLDPPKASKSRIKYNPDYGFVSPVFCVIHWCRDPAIRRQGIRILESASCRDGCWDSELLARVGKTIVALEEKDLGEVTCAADVPTWARLTAIDPEFDLERSSMKMKYWKRSLEGDVVSHEEYVEW